MSSTQPGAGAFPVPSGIVPNIVNPPDHTRDFVILHTICLCFTTFTLCIRLFSRAHITRNFGWDDYMALIAWVMTVSFSGVILAAIPYGFGRHIWDIPMTWIPLLLRLGFAAEIIYLPTVLAVKLTFLLFFNRVFAVNNNTKIKWLVRGAMTANAMFYTAILFQTVFNCQPIRRAWNPFVQGHCQSGDVGPYVSGIWAILSDLYILLLPLYCVWNLQLKIERKLRLTVIFSFGIFACVSSIIRFGYTIRLVKGSDQTWNLAMLSLWSVLEIHVGLICACLPALVPFFERSVPHKFGLGPYFSRFQSFFSRNRSSTDRYKGHSLQLSSSLSRGAVIKIDRDFDLAVVKGDGAPLKGEESCLKL